jgi:hypothetical protein
MRAMPFVCAAVLAGCGGPTWTSGPKFAPVAPQNNMGTVYVYRVPKAASSLAPMVVRVEERVVDVLNGSYAAYYLRPGRHTLSALCAPEYVSMTRWGGITPAFDMGFIDVSMTSKDGTQKIQKVDLYVVPEQPLFVRVECGHLGSDSAKLVPEPEALDAIGDLSLAPGGRARFAWEDLPP